MKEDEIKMIIMIVGVIKNNNRSRIFFKINNYKLQIIFNKIKIKI